MLAIFPLQDWVALDGKLRRKDYENERINQPADPNHHWRWRFHRNMAELNGATALNTEITGMLKDSGRYNG
jgi:4-alpha-glucanotransferase